MLLILGATGLLGSSLKNLSTRCVIKGTSHRRNGTDPYFDEHTDLIEFIDRYHLYKVSRIIICIALSDVGK